MIQAPLWHEHPSPNVDERPDGEEGKIQALLLHYTGMQTGKEALERLCDPEAKVSAHYLVDEDGSIYRMVPDEKRAWHAGLSDWRGRSRLNDCSIGVEIVNPGHEWGYRPFPDAQMVSVLHLCQYLHDKHQFAPEWVIGHSDIAPDRKSDPGELFNWKMLADHGIGIWPSLEAIETPEIIARPEEASHVIMDVQRRLQQLGYETPTNGLFCHRTEAIVVAFRRHFCQHRLEPIWDSEADARLNACLEAMI